MREYPMSLSGGVRFLSAVVSVLILSVPFLVWGLVPGVRLGAGGEIARVTVWLAPVIPLVAWALSPRGIEIQGGEFRVLRRGWRAAAWPLSEVEEVGMLPPRWLRGSIRTFGSGGLFGFYGLYAKGGVFHLFATRSQPLVLVVVGSKRVVVSPDEPARMVEGLLRSAPGARPAQVTDGGAASASTRS